MNKIITTDGNNYSNADMCQCGRMKTSGNCPICDQYLIPLYSMDSGTDPQSDEDILDEIEEKYEKAWEILADK